LHLKDHSEPTEAFQVLLVKVKEAVSIPFCFISPRVATLLRGEEEEGVEWGRLAGRTLGREALLKQKMDGKK
jgi:hypothetical protein